MSFTLVLANAYTPCDAHTGGVHWKKLRSSCGRLGPLNVEVPSWGADKGALKPKPHRTEIAIKVAVATAVSIVYVAINGTYLANMGPIV